MIFGSLVKMGQKSLQGKTATLTYGHATSSLARAADHVSWLFQSDSRWQSNADLPAL